MSRKRFISIRKLLLIGPLALLVLLAVTVYWLLQTSSGAAWIWNRVEAMSPGTLHASQLRGSLASGFEIDGFEYRSNGLDLSVGRVYMEARPRGWPLFIQVRKLALDDVDIVLRSTAGPAPSVGGETAGPAWPAALKLPLAVKLDDGWLTGISLQQDDRPPQALAESISFKATLDGTLVVDRLQLIAQGVDAELRGQLALTPPFDLKASVQGRLDMIADSGTENLTLPFGFECSGDLGQVQFSLASRENGLQLGGQSLGLKISGSVSAGALLISGAELAGPGTGLAFNGKLDWSNEPAAELDVVIGQLDLSPWINGWPAGQNLSGDLQLGWSESRLAIPRGRLTVAGTDLEINLEGDIDTAANSVNARLDWRHLAWPLAAATTDFSSPTGHLNVSGNVDQWEASGQLELRLGDYPQGRFDIIGGGDRRSAHVTIPGGETLGGSISGAAGADWSGALSWNASIQARDVDPEPLLPGWPGRLDADIELQSTSQPQQLLVKLLSARGLLRGIPLTASGGLEIADDRLLFRKVELNTGDALLQLDGALSAPAGMAIKFSGMLPSPLLKGASGRLELDGRYSSYADRPKLEVQLDAQDLVWNGLNIQQLAAHTPDDNFSAILPALQVDASGLRWQDVLLDELTLSVTPAGKQLEVQARAANINLTLDTAMTLTAGNRDELLNGPWSGVLDKLELAVDKLYRFELSEPAAFGWSVETASVGPMCVRESGGSGVCVSGTYQAIGDWSLLADVDAVPLDYLRDLFEMDVHFEQLLAGRLEWRQVHGQAPTGGAEFSISAGQILDRLDHEMLAETSVGRFAFDLKNGNLESGVLAVEFPGTGFIDIEFDVLDLSGEDGQKLQGHAIIQLDELNLPGQLALPWADDIDGRFKSDIQLQGTLSEPDFVGSFKLSNGLLRYAPIGLKLEDIELEGSLEQKDLGRLKGQFRAGEGLASVEGEFVLKDFQEMQLDVVFSGSDLLLINTDALKIHTNVDVKLGFSPQRVDVDGQITIPSARLTPANLLVGKVNDSEDLVVEDQGNGSTGVVDKPSPGMGMYGQLVVAFGDDVLVKVPGVETHIGGSVGYRWNGPRVPLAEGSYELKGEVDVYGPILNIDKGYISFPNVPADNPFLNIRAQREIFGNTQIRSAGVQLIGTLKRPVLEAYTVPVTNEDRAWTLLITGSDFDQSQGVGGFDVGTYIAPRLYVSYGISLFEEENVISARYDLKKGFGVKVTSGQRETGLDVSYTIDR